MMVPQVIPFPLARRVDYVGRQAAFVLSMHAAAGEKHIGRQLSLQRSTLISKGCDPDVVDAEVRGLESAIRAAMWRLVLTPEVG